MRPHGAATLIVFLVWAGPAAGSQDDDLHAIPCRPTVACNADIAAPGLAELELGYQYQALSGGVNQNSVPFLLKLTLAPWVQLQIGSNGLTFVDRPVSAAYFANLAAGLKFHFLDQTPTLPSISLSAAVSIPTGTAPGTLLAYDALLTAYVSKDFGWLHADLNFGLELWWATETTSLQPWVALALSVNLPLGFGLMLENFYFADANPLSPADGGLLMAVSYSPKPWLVFDVGADVGYVPSTRTVSAFAGLTVVLGQLWRTSPAAPPPAVARLVH